MTNVFLLCRIIHICICEFVEKIDKYFCRKKDENGLCEYGTKNVGSS